MTAEPERNTRERAVAAIGVLAIHAALGFALLRGLAVDVPGTVRESLKLLALAPPDPPPPRPIARRHRLSPHRNGAASAANRRAKATDVVAPVPPLPLPPSPMNAAVVAGVGTASATGAAPVLGPGTGSGGSGHGPGSSDAGNGDGGGGGSPLRLVSGQLKDSDYPREAFRARVSGTVGLRFTVGVRGRVTDCTVTRSSGDAGLDDATCALIRERLRYRPETDASGRPVPVTVEGEHVWTLYRRPEE